MSSTVDRYLDQYARARRLHPAEPAFLSRIREEALARFAELGFPTTRHEEWRFTSVAPIAEKAFAPAEPAGMPPESAIARFRVPGAVELVFVNGRYAPALSSTDRLPAGVRAGSLRDALDARHEGLDARLGRVASFAQHPFAALNTALFEDGAYVDVPAGAVLDRPVHVLFVSDEGAPGTAAFPRALVSLGASSQAAVIETHAGLDGGCYFSNAVTELLVGENASLHHYRLQFEGLEAYHVGVVYARAGRAAAVASHVASLGASIARTDVAAVLDGEGGECVLNGLYLADGARLTDHHTTIDHAKPHCGSRQLYKGVLAERGRGVFNGKIIVRPDAQKTDAKQTNRALLLSEQAQINTKPQLEIFANDVKCTHGAAVGQLDEEAVFYLRSRGLSLADARRLLIHAFTGEVVNRMPLEPVRALVERGRESFFREK